MKKLLILLLCLCLCLPLAACGKGQDAEISQMPPGLTAVQNRLKLTKHSETGSVTSFCATDFESLLGQELNAITITDLPKNGNLVCGGQVVTLGQTLAKEQLEYLKFIPGSDCVVSTFGFS